MINFAKKYRPKSLDDVLSQEVVTTFKEFINNNYFPNAILFGPPGCGKTTIARAVANELNAQFFEFNATSIKIDDIRKVIKQYSGSLIKPIIFIDEIHRLSKNQQEVLLPFLENEDAIFIGASTTNPYYTLTSAIRSRTLLFELNPINESDLRLLIEKVAKKEGLTIDKDGVDFIIQSSNKDARATLNLLYSASKLNKNITLDNLKILRKNQMVAGSSEDSEHYNLASALIKSIRGSDIDASLYYLARLIEGGEVAEFIARRLAILASEDIGNANPQAAILASSILNTVSKIGYPEARIPLAQLTIYLASSPKSNSSYKAINQAQEVVKNGKILPVPEHLKDFHKGYKYPHDFGGFVKQKYILEDLKFYKSSKIGFEKTLDEWVDKIKGIDG